MSDSDDLVDLPDDGGDDLFGDADEGAQSDAERMLSDHDLPSEHDGDTQGARDGMGQDEADDDDNDNQMTEQRFVLPVPMYRHKTPKSKDGSVRTAHIDPILTYALTILGVYSFNL